MNNQQKNAQKEFKDSMSFLFSFLIPLVGLILFFVYFRSDRPLAKRCLTAAAIGLAIDLAMSLILRNW